MEANEYLEPYPASNMECFVKIIKLSLAVKFIQKTTHPL